MSCPSWPIIVNNINIKRTLLYNRNRRRNITYLVPVERVEMVRARPGKLEVTDVLKLIRGQIFCLLASAILVGDSRLENLGRLLIKKARDPRIDFI